jgi:2-aminophenol/2-amino-5-chlorophenol 1,6-dioxygenase subunit beta
MVGHHVNGVPNARGVSVETNFPHLFRYHCDFRTDVELAEALVGSFEAHGLMTRAMRQGGVRVEYATIGRCTWRIRDGTFARCLDQRQQQPVLLRRG